MRGAMRVLWIAAACSLLLTLGDARDAAAYPEFQFSTGNIRCSQCHFSPVGGGLINAYGRSEAEDTISMFGGNGQFLYGVWDNPRWVELGIDLRMAGVTKRNGSDTELLLFPMQGDTYGHFRFGKAWSATVIVGPRAQARTPRDSILTRMASREHYVMWKPKSQGLYARAGRFFAPFGLRGQDHTVYTRRYLGFHSFEETYNLSVGRVKNDHEWHTTLFVPPPGILSIMGAGTREMGAAGYYERRMFDKKGAVSVQARVALGDGSDRYTLGGVGKYYIEPAKLLLMGEVNTVLQTFDADGASARSQVAAYLSATWFLRQGLMIGGAYQRFDNDLSIGGTAYDGFQGSVQFIPIPGVELHMLGRTEFRNSLGDGNTTGLFMLHYWM